MTPVEVYPSGLDRLAERGSAAFTAAELDALRLVVLGDRTEAGR